ncbi:T9SS type A sorting domain-containing protein [Flavobacterium nackdongense]|uniref:T9SS type A sorting domain-containing protein n=1 Tax=Flavobacterium nackdongense TaxID=2547394 RepID=A0A4P6Y9P0_9FLAO|nr:T9SS type A sorting domain-containing protein [Flavobacterium nackdongense]QBN17394.1 T9SS type A sorting domain-containing protein [Flavobacterium nackdongense]
MKKIYLVLFLASFCIGNAQINWKRSVANGNLPAWMATANNERGTAALNDKMYVVSRATTPPTIRVINGVDGTDAAANVSNYTGVIGGNVPLNDVEVSANGAILACNLMVNGYVSPANDNSTFKIYKWDSETAVPTLYTSYNGSSLTEQVRLGDTFSVTGDISSNAVIFAAGRTVAPTTGFRVIRWIVTGGAVETTPTVITIPALTASTTIVSVTPLGLTATSRFIVKASGNLMTVHNADGSVVPGESIPEAVLPKSANDIRYFEVGLKKYVAAYLYGGTNELAKLIDVTTGFASASTVAVTPALGTVSNGNTSGGIGLKVVPDLVDGIANTITVYTLAGNNGISGTTLVKDGVTVVLGNKDFSAANARKATKIFPNPARNEFYIAIDTDIDKDAQAYIYDIQGRQVKSAKIQDNVQTINIQDLNAGEYVVKVVNGSINNTAKLLKK